MLRLLMLSLILLSAACGDDRWGPSRPKVQPVPQVCHDNRDGCKR